MVDTYSPNLALTLQGTGTNSGTWGDITDNNLGTLIEQAISGYVTQAITDGAATVITIPNGATGVARNMTLELTGALTAARVLEVPANKKLYFIYNNTTGGYAVTVKVSGQTGVSVPNGKKMILVSNGTDIVEAVNYAGTISGGSLTLTGNLSVGGTSGFTGVATFTAQPIMSSLTASQAVFTDGSKGLVSNAITGTGNVVMSNSPTLVTPALGTPSSGVVTNLTGTASININGTVGATTPTTGAFTTLSASSSVTFSGGTANGVVYLNGSKVATSGSALTFDGTALAVGATGYPFINPTGYYVDGGYAAYISGTSRNGFSDMVFTVRSSEAMRLTSTGLGIGTSSPGYKLDIAGQMRVSATNAIYYATGTTGWSGVSVTSTGGNVLIGCDDSSASTFGTVAYASIIRSLSKPLYIQVNGNNSIFDASGNLGLGVTPSSWGSQFKALEGGDADNQSAVTFQTNTNAINLHTNSYYNVGYKYKFTGTAGQYVVDGNTHSWYNASSGTAGNPITFTQAMTLDASGNLLVGATSNAQTGAIIHARKTGAAAIGASSDTTAYYARLDSASANYAYWNCAGVNTGSISTNGTLTLYNTSSDQRLKTNIVNAPDASLLIDSIKVRSFDWLADGSHQRYGMVAQELLEVAPEAVCVPTDEDEMMGVDYSKLVPILVKEIQSLRARVANLEKL